MRNNFRIPFLSVFLLLAFFCAASEAQEFSIEAQVDKTEVKCGESLTLVLTVTQSLSGSSVSAPRLPKIPGFDVVSTRTGQNMTIVNGVGQIQLQVVAELVPDGPGTKVIPAMSLNGPKGKTFSTKAISIKVLPPSKEPGEEASSNSEEGTAPKEENSGISWKTGLLVMALIAFLVLAIPVGLSWFLNPDVRSKKPVSPNEEKETIAEIIPPSHSSPHHSSQLSNFPQEVETLKRLHPDADIQFYRAYFDLFRKAILERMKTIDPSMTPDALIKHVADDLPKSAGNMALELGKDWEAVAFARTKPFRGFSVIHESALSILQSIRR